MFFNRNEDSSVIVSALRFITGDINNTFALHGVISDIHFPMKTSFSAKKHPRWNLSHTFEKKLLKFNMLKYYRRIILMVEVRALIYRL